jgi:hypothetical protein
MHAEDEHPDLSLLGAYALGRLESVEMGRLESHLARCSTCTRAALAVPEDDLIRSLRRGAASDGIAECSAGEG